jgi:hypothetical protein
VAPIKAGEVKKCTTVSDLLLHVDTRSNSLCPKLSHITQVNILFHKLGKFICYRRLNNNNKRDEFQELERRMACKRGSKHRAHKNMSIIYIAIIHSQAHAYSPPPLTDHPPPTISLFPHSQTPFTSVTHSQASGYCDALST